VTVQGARYPEALARLTGRWLSAVGPRGLGFARHVPPRAAIFWLLRPRKGGIFP